MPTVIAGGVATLLGGLAAEMTFMAALKMAVVSTILSGLSMALMPKPKTPDTSMNLNSSAGRSRAFRQSLVPREIIYGEVRKAGGMAELITTQDRKYLHMIVMLCSHEITAVDEYVLNGVSIPLDAIDANGNVTSGVFANRLRLRTVLGGDDQTADSYAVSEIPEWTTNHRLRGIAYIYIRFQKDRDVYESGQLDISAWIRGKPIEDVRDIGGTKRSFCNMANIAYDYFTWDRWGLNGGSDRIDLSTIQASANTCDEIVDTVNQSYSIVDVDTSTDIMTVSGDLLGLQRGDVVRFASLSIGGLSSGVDYYVIPYQRMGTPRIKVASSLDNAIVGTAVSLTSTGSATIIKVGEPRYHGSGILEVGTDEMGNMENIMLAMAGDIVQTGEDLYFLAGEYRTPTVSLDITDLAGEISVQPQLGIDNRFNRVFGSYYTPLKAGFKGEYPAVFSSIYITDDGEEISQQLDLNLVTRSNTAQRIAKIKLDRNRADLSFTARFKMTAFQLKTLDNFYFSFPRYGWENKIFEVKEWRLSVEESGGVAVPYIEMTCQENSSDVWDFDKDVDETSVNPDGLNLPDKTIPIVEGFSLDSVVVTTKDGDSIYEVRATWLPNDNISVIQGGKYEIFYKKSATGEYGSAGSVDGDTTEMTIPTLEPDIEYDFRIYAYSKLGARSAAYSILGFKAGQTVVTNVEDWENETLSRDGDDWESDSLTSEDWES